MQVDLNADLGEGVTDDAALLAIVSSANVACGFHAGSVEIMARVCAEAVPRGVSVGAHVAYADRENFGRSPRDVPTALLTEQIAEQVGLLQQVLVREGGELRYLKPHGALYHRVIDDPEQATAVLDGSAELPILGMRGSVLAELATGRGRSVNFEGFPDRGYDLSGRLLRRDHKDAFVVGAELVAARAVELVRGPWAVDSVCVHGDSPGAVASAAAVREALTQAGFALVGL